MKRIIAIVLLFAFITVNFSKVIIWAHYELYKTEITQKYCVNKDKPQMHCCGKCLLKKKLAEDDAKEKSPAMPDIKNDIQLFASAGPLVLKNLKSEYLLIDSPYNNIYLQGISGSVFHPPCA